MQSGEMHRANRFFATLISIVVVLAIILSVLQTLLENLALVLQWTPCTRLRLQWAGLVLDVLFSVEFAARSVLTLSRGQFGRAFISQRGWVDLISSWPLAPVSFSIVLSQYFPEGGWLAGVALAARSWGIFPLMSLLRTARILKIFNLIPNPRSLMTNHHLATVSLINLATLLVILGGAQIVPVLHFADERSAALFILLCEVCLLGVVGVTAGIYGPVFRRSVADPVALMDRGMRDWESTAEVMLDKRIPDEEMQRLARVFNRRWLPIKSQILHHRRRIAPEDNSHNREDGI